MSGRPCRSVRRNADVEHMLRREQERRKIKELRKILRKEKAEQELTEEESKILAEHSNIVTDLKQQINKHRSLSERTKEQIDAPDELKEKCRQLAEALKESSSAVIYTGAGISTAAHIPDYRGPDGVWTLLKKGEKVQVQDLSAAEPTFTHMAVKQMYKLGLISHVVSQNCDGLHLRSGLPSKALSEIHGNMFIEVCTKCKPIKQYVRLFDVTENTGLHRHKTGRFCKKCRSELKDTIVHFGESGKIPWPLNWKGAAKKASDTDLIICLGSSLKVLKRYHCLWNSNKPASKRPKLYIVNLQWTPKDLKCTLKINGKCDEVMQYVTSFLDIKVPVYKREEDPIFKIAVPLTDREKDTTTRKELAISPAVVSPEVKVKVDNETATRIKSESPPDEESKENVKVEPSEQLTSETDIECEDSNEPTKSIMKSENAGDTEVGTSAKRSCSQLSGWYGKGSAKWKRVKKKRLK